MSGYLLDPCPECGRERKEHTESEAVFCIVRSIQENGYRVVLPPGYRRSYQEGRIVRRGP
jgi:hypothetical protein